MEKGRSKTTASDKEDSVSLEEAGQEVMDTGAAFVAASDEEDVAAEDKGVKMQACSVCLQERYVRTYVFRQSTEWYWITVSHAFHLYCINDIMV